MTTKTARAFIALGDKNDALIASAALIGAIGSKTIDYAFSVPLDSRLWDAAHAVGMSRTLIKKLRGRNAWENRGADDERIDTEGALAEIIIALALEKAPAVTVAPLVAHKPDAGGVDITLAGSALDVKSVGQSRSFININARQHSDKGAAAYVLVHLARADVADVYVVSAKAVEAWRLNTNLRGVPLDPRRYYYSCKLPVDGMEALPVEAEA